MEQVEDGPKAVKVRLHCSCVLCMWFSTQLLLILINLSIDCTHVITGMSQGAGIFPLGARANLKIYSWNKSKKDRKLSRFVCVVLVCHAHPLFCFVLFCLPFMHLSTWLDSQHNCCSFWSICRLIACVSLQEWNWDTGRSQGAGVFPLGARANLKIYSWNKSKTERKLSRFVCVVLVCHVCPLFCFVLFCFVSLSCISRLDLILNTIVAHFDRSVDWLHACHCRNGTGTLDAHRVLAFFHWEQEQIWRFTHGTSRRRSESCQGSFALFLCVMSVLCFVLFCFVLSPFHASLDLIWFST